MKTLKILIACEESQTVATAFRSRGFFAFSNDINPCYGGHPEYHIIGDAAQVVKGNNKFVTEDGNQVIIDGAWDLIIAHPPCTYLTHCGAQHLHSGKHTMEQVRDAASFFMQMLNAPCEHIAVENPAPMKIAGLPKYTQIVQPYEFGEPYSKRVCLWLKNLPPLFPVYGYYTEHQQWLRHCNSTARRRSKTFQCIADTMAESWGGWLMKQQNR